MANKQRIVLGYYLGNRRTGSLHRVHGDGENYRVETLPPGAESGREALLKPVLVGLAATGGAILWDPGTRHTYIANHFPPDTFPAHQYTDPYSTQDWYMNDGDKATGNDTVHCAQNGSSVTIIAATTQLTAAYVGTVCVGRGHHQAAFMAPSAAFSHHPRRAFISNLTDGTVSVIGNDPDDDATYLRCVATINLCEAEREEGDADKIPNSAFPHGLAYSSLTGKLYNLNNGYGTIAVIDPVSGVIEQRVALKGYSNLFAVPGGRYLIARGADRKSDPQHVIAHLAVLDVQTLQVVDHCELRDIYLSKYFFTPQARTLYFTTGSSGSPEQLAHLKTDVTLALDLSALPKLGACREIKTGAVGTLAFAGEQRVYASQADTGALAVIDGATDTVLQSVAVTTPGAHSRVWTIEVQA